jgi:hypothetical protein
MPDSLIIRVLIDGRPHWQWGDGTLLPVVSGGDGDEPPMNAAAAFSEALEQSAGDEGPSAQPPGDEQPTDAPRMVPWDEHVRLRRENATYRQRWQPYEEAFDGLEDDVRGAFLELARMYREDPEQAAARLLEAFGLAPPTAGEDGPPQYLTRDDFRAEMDAFWAEQQRRQREQEVVEGARETLRNTAKELGFEPGTRQYRQLLSLAADEFATDELGNPREPAEMIRLAADEIHRGLAEFEKKSIARYLEGKSQPGVTPVGVGEPGSPEKVPTTLEEASRAFKAAIGA